VFRQRIEERHQKRIPYNYNTKLLYIILHFKMTLEHVSSFDDGNKHRQHHHEDDEGLWDGKTKTIQNPVSIPFSQSWKRRRLH